MKANKRSLYSIGALLVIATIILNYMANFGLLFPYSQQEISDMYANLLAPSSFTFSIWGLIYLGVLAFFIFPWVKNLTENDKHIYFKKLMPPTIAWTIANLAWTITWNNDLIFLSLIAIIAYTISLLQLLRVLYSHPGFSKRYKWMVSVPIGLHAGWLIFASSTNVMTLLVKSGLDPFGLLGVILTIILMSLACIAELWTFRRYGNSFVTVPALWALIGIFVKQLPGSDFSYSNNIVLYTSVVFFILSLIGHLAILRKNKSI